MSRLPADSGGTCSRSCLEGLSELRWPWERPLLVEPACTSGSGLPLGRAEFQVSFCSFRERQGTSYLCSSEPSRTPGSGTFVHPASPVPAVPTAGLVGARMRRKPRASHGGRNVPHFRPGEVCTAGSAETPVPRAVAPPSCSSPLPEDLSRNQQPRPPDLTPPGVLCSLKAREWSSVTDRPGAEPRRPGRRRGQLQTPA